MGTKIRVWLDEDRQLMHHAESAQAADMTQLEFEGSTDCGAAGMLRLVHHENVDMGSLCPGCMAVSGVRPSLAGQDLGPV